MIVLGIETSCDETAVAIYGEAGLMAHEIYSQIVSHQPYGGVVPELAARDHVRKLLPLVQQTLQLAKISPGDVSAIAYTSGPGLVGALMVGAAFGASLAYSWGVPAIEVHHMEAHLMAAMLENKCPQYPFLALLVSGGHTLLVDVRAFGDYVILGQSVDDAVGEAFDKTAKLLGLPYPGGPALAELALSGTSGVYHFPRPMAHAKNLNMSFSGLKTAAVKAFNDLAGTASEQNKADIAIAFQQAAVDSLLIKVRRAVVQTGYSQIAVVGGVSANKHLRHCCNQWAETVGVECFYPRHELCTDNGAMVAYTGYLRAAKNCGSSLAIKARSRWSLESL
jgi:N6-L-threonylcarbamoyladenine synthase